MRVDNAGTKLDLPAQLFRPAGNGRFAAVAIFHGCGGPGRTPRAWPGLLRDWGYVALVVDSFSSRGLTDVCGRNWPTPGRRRERAPRDIDAALQWLAGSGFRRSQAAGVHGLLLRRRRGHAARAVAAPTDAAPIARAAILVYPDCALADALGPKLAVRQPTLFAMGALDDWTPVSQCQAVIGRVVQGRDLVETRIYEGAHHSFDALGLPVRYLPGVGNRSKPGGCCGAHYGANEAAWKAFVTDVKAFLARVFAT